MTIKRISKIAPDGKILKQKIHEHELWLRDKSKYEKGDFSYFDFKNYIFSPNINIFESRNLSEADFKNSQVSNLEFSGAKLKGTNFRGANYDFLQFSEIQKKEAIFTDKDYDDYLERKKLEEENQSLKNRNIKNEITLENINEEKTEKLVLGFEKLQNEFAREERIWLFITYLSFITIFGLAITLILDIFIPQITGISFLIIFISVIFLSLFIPLQITKEEQEEKDIPYKYYSFPKWKDIKFLTKEFLFRYPEKELFTKYYKYLLIGILLIALGTKFTQITNVLKNQDTSIFNFSNPYYSLLPLSIILFSFLYFSVYQYSKAKSLRIDNQNKVTGLYGFEAIKTDITPDINKGRFYDKIADEVFKGVFEEKNTGGNLPIDKVIDIITSLKK